ncbi:hypothetical protein [Gabonibacter chumensis]|uniref:hypothetical protein n=1 Tax=Gabonibacter chumensis TaxID=2972474 RepID=UPI0025723B2A|nr:hypothetical protein [Gabonibacter chumensis]MCR9012821.1 hypothetical protein [Gabonibacter chumensis]
MKNIIITLDYELCLGQKTGGIYDTLILTTNKLLDLFSKYKVKVTFMVDMAYLLRMKELSLNNTKLQEEYLIILNHLKEINNQGHDLELHLHPQWLYSTHDGSEWHLDFKHYKLSDLNSNEVKRLFSEAIDLLSTIKKDKVIAFRAGGFSLQTLENYGQILRANEIKVDTSVVPGEKENSIYHVYDFSHIPKKDLYPFQDNVSIEVSNIDLYELPISTISYNPFKYLLIKKKLKTTGNYTLYTRGVGIGNNLSKMQVLKHLLPQLLRKKSTGASLDGIMSAFLLKHFNKYCVENPNFENYVILGHPKGVSDDSLKNTEYFLKATVGNYKFLTIRELISSKIHNKNNENLSLNSCS